MSKTDTTPLSLPDPRETSSRDVMIFDGQCKFCRKQVARVRALDWGNRLSFISLHDPWVQETYPEFTHDQLMEEMVVVDVNQGKHGGAAAFRYLSRRLPTLWFLAPLMHLPFSLPLWSLIYRTIARQRYRWGRLDDSCENGSCDIHFK